jgi:hypothetical protein
MSEGVNTRVEWCGPREESDPSTELRVVPSKVEGRVFGRRSASEWGWGPPSGK